MEPLRVALVAASPLVRAGLRAGLLDTGGFEPVLDSPSLGDAQRHRFAAADVALVALTADGDGATQALPDAPPLVLLLPDALGLAEGWWREGASVLPGDAPITLIAAAVRAAAAGLLVCAPSFALRRHLASPTEAPEPPLTARERQVLAQMTAGLGNRQIAELLHISPHTAKFHVAQIIAKLDASSRAHAVAKGLRAGLVTA